MHSRSKLEYAEQLHNDAANAVLTEVDSDDTVTDLADSKLDDLTQSIQGVFQQGAPKAKGNNTKLPIAGKLGHINVSVAAQAVNYKKPKAVPAKKLPVRGKVGHINVSVAVPAPVNQTAVVVNKTKVIEEAVVSLPMAGFILDTPVPAKNKTAPKFPGNASQKAAFEKKEKSLEDEVKMLKARLNNASDSMASLKAKSLPVATGTFHANFQKANDKSANTFMAPKGPEPMQPLKAESTVKADWPTMASVAAPVKLQHVKDVVAPPQSDAIKAQEGNTKKVSMGSTFTGTPGKKVQSVIALEASVEHGVAAVDLQEDTDTAGDEVVPPSPMLGWASSVYSGVSSFGMGLLSFFRKPAAHAVSKAPAAALTQTLHSTIPSIPVKQDSARTAMAALEDSQHVFEVQDAWSSLEKEDNVKVERVRGEDQAERRWAETAQAPHKLSGSEVKGLQGRHGVPMSGFWGQLEKEDYDIEDIVKQDDMIKYQQVTQAQDLRVSEAADKLDVIKLQSNQMESQHNSDARIAIHEPWLAREARDKAREQAIHDEPNLQMLQLKRQHRRHN